MGKSELMGLPWKDGFNPSLHLRSVVNQESWDPCNWEKESPISKGIFELAISLWSKEANVYACQQGNNLECSLLWTFTYTAPFSNPTQLPATYSVSFEIVNGCRNFLHNFYQLGDLWVINVEDEQYERRSECLMLLQEVRRGTCCTFREEQ